MTDYTNWAILVRMSPPKDQWEKIKLMNYDFQCMLQRCCNFAAHVILGLHVHNKPQTPLTYLQTNANSL